MTKERISTLRRITPWPTLLLLLGSATYSAFISANLWGFGAALAGAAIGAFDRHLGMELSKLEKEAREAAEKRLLDVESSLEDANSRLNNPHLKRIVEDAEWEHYAAHYE